MALARPKVRADPTWIVPLAALGMLAVLSALVDPGITFLLLGGAFAFGVMVARPHLGVVTIMVMLLIQYGERRGEAFGEVVTGGVGLLTINNILGLFLAVLLAYHVYVSHSWSFLRSRQVQLLLFISTVLIISAVLATGEYADLDMLGLRRVGQNPWRLLLSRVLFVVLIVGFVRGPGELRLMVGVFLALALGTALGGLSGALGGEGYRAETAGYRAGGVSMLIEEARNPNRLALVCTLALVFIWEYGETFRYRWRRWLTMGAVVTLILTVFLTASRGGVVGLAVTGLLLLASRGHGARRVAHGAIVALLAAMLVGELIPEQTAERLSNIPGGFEEPMGEEGTGSLYRRRYGWQVAFDMSTRHPILGVGLNNWGLERFRSDPKRITTPPHNAYLLALAEGGLVTLSLYLVLYWVTLKRLRELENDPNVMHRAREDGLDWILRGTRLCLLSYMVFSFFSDIWQLVSFYLLIGLAAALIARYGTEEPAHVPA